MHSVDGYLYDMDAFSKELLWNKNDPSNIYKSYYGAIEKLIQSNLFDQVGHPDVIKLYSIDPGYDLHPTSIISLVWQMNTTLKWKTTLKLIIHIIILILA